MKDAVLLQKIEARDNYKPAGANRVLIRKEQCDAKVKLETCQQT
jgi:hypothetical protein